MRALLIALVLLFGAGQAAAHATLLSTSPQDGATLAQPPTEVVLRFDEPVAALAMRIVDSTGGVLTLPALVEGASVRVALPSSVQRGAFVFSYRVASADSHPVAGAITFAVGDGQPPMRGSADQPAAATLGAGWSAMRALRDLLLLVAAGGALFMLCVGAFPLARQVVGASAIGAALTTLLAAGVQGSALIEPPSGLLAGLALAWQTSAGVSAWWTMAACLAMAGGVRVADGRLRRLLLWGGALAAPASLALTGHAASTAPGWASMATVAAHALAAAFWSGSLVALWLLMTAPRADAPGGPSPAGVDEPAGDPSLPGRRRDAAPAQALRRFSTLATPAVLVLAACGVAFAALQIGSVGDLVATGYGRLVVAKAALLAVLLAMAARNRFVLLPRLEQEAAQGGAALRWSIVGEMVLIVAVVALTAVLSRTPPRAGTAITVELAATDPYRGRLTVTPGRAGRNTFVVELRDRQGQPADPAQASLRLSHAGAGIEAIDRELTRSAAGHYRYEGSDLALRGAWTIGVRARIGEFDLVEMQTTVDVP